MRKDVTLGMTIGGGLLAVALVGVIAVSHKGNNRHGGVETTLMNNSGGAGDIGGDTGAADQTAPAKQQDDKPAARPEDKPSAKPAKNTQLAKADPKDDPVTKTLFFGGSTPLIGSSQTPDPSGSSEANGAVEASSSNAEHKGATDEEKKPDHVGPGVHSEKPARQATGDAKPVKPAAADEHKASEPTATPQSAPSGAVAKSHTHKVQKGETFSTIAAAAYGSANYYPYIMRANPKVDARALKPGMELTLPDIAEVKGTGSSEEKAAAKGEAIPASFHKIGAAPLDASKEYKVVAGDSLNKIAIRLYGKQDMSKAIYEANRSTIGGNPAAIKIGMVLKLPQPPVMAATTSAR